MILSSHQPLFGYLATTQFILWVDVVLFWVSNMSVYPLNHASSHVWVMLGSDSDICRLAQIGFRNTKWLIWIRNLSSKSVGWRIQSYPCRALVKDHCRKWGSVRVIGNMVWDGDGAISTSTSMAGGWWLGPCSTLWSTMGCISLSIVFGEAVENE